MPRSARITGVVLILTAAIVLLFSFAARAEDEPVALDVPEGVVCRVPGRASSVTLPEGKLLPLPVWSRLDTQVSVLQRDLARSIAERAEEQRQVEGALVHVAAVSVLIGVVAGALGYAIVQKPPW